jgi:hypothetical protein
MSATGRGTIRNANDFYPTPDWCIEEALWAFFSLERSFLLSDFILDPSAGLRPYERALKKRGFENIFNFDINPAANPDVVTNFLAMNFQFKPRVIITNPPYNLAQEFVIKSLSQVQDQGFVIFLLRLNFFGSQKRANLFKAFPPKYCFVHSRRPSFTGHGTDATEYAHFVWQKGFVGMTSLKVL